MKVLMIGDVISQVGCDFLRAKLPQFKRDEKIDVVIANGENSAVGNGILPNSANFLLDSGVDVITTGNHVFKRYEIQNYLDENPCVIRPANFPSEVFGNGYYIYDGGNYNLCVVNLMGTSFMEPLDCPFATMDKLLKKFASIKPTYILVDFHAEATGEKKAMGYYLDGKVSAIVGTHTHVQTADERILPQGSGFITDLGMTGPIDSVLGINPHNVIARLKTHLPTRFEVPNTACQMEGVLLELGANADAPYKCSSIKRIHLE